MINRFLNAKHWQLFLLTFGVPMVFQFILVGQLMFNVDTKTNFDQTQIINYMKLFPIITIIFMAVFFGWFWSIAIGLQKKVPQEVTMKVKKFKIFFFIPMLYMLAFIAFLSVSINSIFSSNPAPGFELIGGLLAVILPLHFFSVFCIFYCLYFVAKTFKTVELQREVKFGDFAGEFFMIWFYPIGIWIIQPKINKMI